MDQLTLTAANCRSYIEKRLFEPVSLVKSPASSDNTCNIGIELELFPFIKDLTDARGTGMVSLHGGESLTNALFAVASIYAGVASYWKPSHAAESYVPVIDKIEFPNGNRFLFEPGGQLEISTAPSDNLQELEARLVTMQAILDHVTRESEIQFAQTGTNPWFDVNEIGIQLQKPRYRALGKYFDRISQYGKQMMLQTCSMHINIDLGEEMSTRVKRIVLANLLVPFVTAMFANSSTIAGNPSGYKSYRSFIWQHTDVTRTGILSDPAILQSMNKDKLIDAYCSFVLKAPLIYVEHLEDQVLPLHYTFEYWLTTPIEGVAPHISDLDNHISLLFPEVRVKGYLEMRSVDAPPVEWQMVPVYFYAGIFFPDGQMEKTLELLLPYALQLDHLWKSASWGLASDEIFQLAKKLMQLAVEGVSSLPAEFKNEYQEQKLISFYERFILQRKAFCDEYPY